MKHPTLKHGKIFYLTGLTVLLLCTFISVTARAQHPLEPPDTSSPRATMKSFLSYIDEIGRLYKDFREAPSPSTQAAMNRAGFKAVLLLDLSKVPPAAQRETGPETFVLLWEILTRLELPPLDEIPETSDVINADTDKIKVTYWRIPHTSITISQVKKGPRAGEYLFSPDTVENVRSYYEQIRHLPYRRPMPTKSIFLTLQQVTGWMISPDWVESLPGWSKTLVFEQVLWKWFAVVLLFALATVLVILVHKVTRRKPLDESWHSYLRRSGTPASMILIALLLYWFIPEQINTTGTAASLYSYILIIVFYIAIVWFVMLTMRWISKAVFASSTRIREKSLDAHLLRLAERSIGTLVIVILLFRFLQDLGVPVYGLVAGAGVGGVAIALAAKSTLENFLGTLNIFADRPVRVGDFCRYGEDSKGWPRIGTVEEIGLRSTRIRGLDRTITTIPNGEFSNTHIVNLSQRNLMILRMNIGLRLETTTDQLRMLLVMLREMLLAHPRITEEPARVRVNAIKEYSIELEIFSYVNTTDWDEFLAVQEDVILRSIDIVNEAGTAFAVPARTIYHRRDPGLNSEQQQAAEKQVQEWIAAQTLPFPDFTEEQKQHIVDTLDYPPKGSTNTDKN